jgi:hypothetical protein
MITYVRNTHECAGDTLEMLDKLNEKTEEINDIVKNPLKIYPFIERQSSLYFAYFSPRNLFFDPDPMKTRAIPETSTFYFWKV